MKAVVQRVKKTQLFVDGKLISEIPFGLTVFLGVTHEDTQKEADYIVKKIAGLRIFEDENGKMNLSVKDVCAVRTERLHFCCCKDKFTAAFVANSCLNFAHNNLRSAARRHKCNLAA